MKNALITTTIRIPHNLEAYAADIAKHGPADTAIVVAGDKKTPLEIQQFLDNLTKIYGVPTFYLTPELQDLMYPAYSKWLPWNCVQRRNMAILYAYHAGAEVIATTDDDNFWEGEGYFTQHNVKNISENLQATHSETGWFNICGVLVEEKNKRFYPRGFSLSERNNTADRYPKISNKIEGKVVVNAGLWIGDPDVDAVTRLAISPSVSRIFEGPGYEGDVVLDLKTKCPFNSQNTALHRDTIPAYCMIPGTGRYDDIIPSYVVKRIADHLEDYIRFSEPIVRQVRNEHDLWKDLEDEKIGMQLTDRIVDWLYEIPLTGKTYKECVLELLPAFSEKYKNTSGLTSEQEDFLWNIVKAYQAWVEVV